MPAIRETTKTGPRTYVPAIGAPITAGQLVEARAAANGIGRIGPAAAGSFVVLGVALTDAYAPEDISLASSTINGKTVVNAFVPAANCAVSYAGSEVPVTYAAAATFGQLLVAAANGQVTPAGATPDARTIVGRCAAPLGVSGAGVVGLMRTAI